MSSEIRSSSFGAELSSALIPPGLVGITGLPSGQAAPGLTSGHSIGGAPFTAPSSWIVLGPVKLPRIVAVVPSRIGTSGFTLTRTRTNCGSFQKAISLTCPEGTPEKVTAEPGLSPSTDCLKKMSYSRALLPPSCASQTMNSASIASRISTTAPTRTWFDRVSISTSCRGDARAMERALTAHRAAAARTVEILLDPRMVQREQFGNRADRDHLVIGEHRDAVADRVQAYRDRG